MWWLLVVVAGVTLEVAAEPAVIVLPFSASRLGVGHLLKHP
jgi:hypothetical protein